MGRDSAGLEPLPECGGLPTRRVRVMLTSVPGSGLSLHWRWSQQCDRGPAHLCVPASEKPKHQASWAPGGEGRAPWAWAASRGAAVLWFCSRKGPGACCGSAGCPLGLRWVLGQGTTRAAGTLSHPSGFHGWAGANSLLQPAFTEH